MGNEIKYFNKSVLSFMKLIIEKGIEVNNNLNGIVLKKINYSKYPKELLVDKYEMDEKKKKETWNNFYTQCCKDEYLGYYWFEFKINLDEYRITMFAKDFDEGSGNIHILPGMIQLWRKYEKITNVKDDIFFAVKKDRTTRKPYRIKQEKERNTYKSVGGANFQEGKWKPLVKENTANNPCVWDISANTEIYESAIKTFWETNKTVIITGIKGLCVGKNAYMLYGKGLKINSLYKENRLVEKARNSGKFTYVLYKWDDNGENYQMKAYYKHMWVECEEAYFVVFDGENHILSTQKNKCGPNYLVDKKWKINYEENIKEY